MRSGGGSEGGSSGASGWFRVLPGCCLATKNVRNSSTWASRGTWLTPRWGTVRCVCIRNIPEGEAASAAEKVLCLCVFSTRHRERCASGYTGLTGTAPPAATVSNGWMSPHDVRARMHALPHESERIAALVTWHQPRRSQAFKINCSWHAVQDLTAVSVFDITGLERRTRHPFQPPRSILMQGLPGVIWATPLSRDGR